MQAAESLNQPEENALRSEVALCYRMVASFGWTEMIFNHIQMRLPEGATFLLVVAAGRCPPEDVGGAPGYAEYLYPISGPAHPEHEHMRLCSPERFDSNVIDWGHA